MSYIPLVDLSIQHREIETELAGELPKMFSEACYILGEAVERFEEAFAAFCGITHCVSVANGTDALELSLRACGIGTGDEIIVPTNTFIATAAAVVRAGATPVLVDCDPVHHLIDPDQVEERIGSRTRAIVPVHLFGQLASMESLVGISDAKGIVLIEDAAQAHGASRNGRPAGSFGAAAGTSFYPGKNLGAYGDAGAVLTDSPETAARIRILRNYGSNVKYQHPELGFNSRLDTIQAVVLLSKLKRLKEWNEERHRAAELYLDLLKDVPDVQLPFAMEGNEHVWHLFVIQVPRRDAVLDHLHRSDIGAGIHYPVPIHLQGAFRELGHQVGDFPISERFANEMISLPLFPGITPDQQERVASSLLDAVKS